uniref:Uncharacterized protein n=1 Tax=Tanacetum cinerariifolium TaxID=118510 RepID=A0A699KGD8_TANCI|nr:hypothetical protein [Tanacetum cinerariifolium]
MRFVSRHEDTQVYGALLSKAMTNQAMLNSDSHKTYYAIALGEEPPKSKKPKKKSDSAISSEETPSKKKPASKPKPNKKKAHVKADRGKGLNVLSEVALSDAAQLKEATKRSKNDFYISHASGSCDGTDFQSGVSDEQQCKISESWGDSREEDDDDKDDTKDDEGNDDGDDNDNDDGDDNDSDDDDNGDDDDDDSDQERTVLDKDENPNLKQLNEEHKEKEEKNVDEFTDKEDDEENEEELDDGEELYKDVNMSLRKEDVEMTDVDQGGADQHNKSEGPIKSSYVSSDFTKKLLNFENVSPTNNEIAFLMDTVARTKEPIGQTSTLFTVPITVISTTIPPSPHFFNLLPQQTTPTPTPTALEVTTAFPTLPDFASIFIFNNRVTNLEIDLS